MESETTFASHRVRLAVRLDPSRLDGRGGYMPAVEAKPPAASHTRRGTDGPAPARVPTLVLTARTKGDDSAFAREKACAAADVRAIGGLVWLEWIDGIHDVSLQHPDRSRDGSCAWRNGT